MNAHFFLKLKFSAFEITVEVTNTLIWTPGFKGILLRDSVGNVLKQMLEPERYHFLWEQKLNKVIAEVGKIGEDAPRGYIIEPPNDNRRKYNEGEQFKFRLVLVGSLIEYLDDFVSAFERLGSEYWLGRKKGYGSGKYKIKNINLITAQLGEEKLEHHANSGKNKNLVINFITPTRIVNENTKRPFLYSGSDTLTFTFFIKALYKRLYLLENLVCGNAALKYNPDSVLSYSDEIKTTHSNLIFHDLENHASKGIQKFGGFTGEIIFVGEIEPYIEMIKLGESLHVGKDYVYGLGKYEIL
jgi:hypothetical protein